MTTSEYLHLLNGRQVDHTLSESEELALKQDGLVIAFAPTDDCISFRGAFETDVDAYLGGDFWLSGDDAYYECPELCPAVQISAYWRDPDTDVPWVFGTDLPHENFMIYKGREEWCEGILFSLNDLRRYLIKDMAEKIKMLEKQIEEDAEVKEMDPEALRIQFEAHRKLRIKHLMDCTGTYLTDLLEEDPEEILIQRMILRVANGLAECQHPICLPKVEDGVPCYLDPKVVCEGCYFKEHVQ